MVSRRGMAATLRVRITSPCVGAAQRQVRRQRRCAHGCVTGLRMRSTGEPRRGVCGALTRCESARVSYRSQQRRAHHGA